MPLTRLAAVESKTGRRTHTSRSEDATAKSGDIKTLQEFAAAHASSHNHFNRDHQFSYRNHSAALAEWRQLACPNATLYGALKIGSH